ncbi:MAG TPA: LPS export ABC transporter periplasmic protein LptC [Oculatellaceae cyanobacterium]|jgi:LPS export ABC transporter protein LptC
MTSPRNLVAVALLLLLCGAGLAIWNAERQEPVVEEVPVSQSPQMIGQNVSFTVTEGEVKKWTLDAVQAVYNEARTEALLEGVQGEFFDPAGKSVLKFTAPKGEWRNKNNEIVLKGGVVATSTQKDGGELRAPTMHWDATDKEVVATGGIELIHQHGKSLAQTCRFNLDFSKISLQGNVTSTVSSP